MAMYTHRLVPPPSTVSAGLGEARSAKRGAVSMKLLAAMNGLGGLKDKSFTAEVERSVKDGYQELVTFHETQTDKKTLVSSVGHEDQKSDNDKGFNQPATGKDTGIKIRPVVRIVTPKYSVEDKISKLPSVISDGKRSNRQQLKTVKRQEYDF